jgi:hypothetical protein
MRGAGGYALGGLLGSALDVGRPIGSLLLVFVGGTLFVGFQLRR